MQDNLVTIITPIYNGERYISETIESVLLQSYPNWEMIIINDGSTDNSASVVNSYVVKDPRIKLLTQINSGSAVARNNSIRNANGRFIALLDSDDLWDPIFIESQLSLMKEKDAVLVCSSYR